MKVELVLLTFLAISVYGLLNIDKLGPNRYVVYTWNICSFLIAGISILYNAYLDTADLHQQNYENIINPGAKKVAVRLAMIAMVATIVYNVPAVQKEPKVTTEPGIRKCDSMELYKRNSVFEVILRRECCEDMVDDLYVVKGVFGSSPPLSYEDLIRERFYIKYSMAVFVMCLTYFAIIVVDDPDNPPQVVGVQ